MKEQIKRIAEQNPYGFTVDLRTMQTVYYGFVVAYAATQNSFGDAGLEKALSHAMQHDCILGGWLNTENQQYYYDSCKVFAEQAKAHQFAIDNEQMAYFSLHELKEITL